MPLKLILLHLQRLSLLATIDGQMKVLALPLDREYSTKVLMAHANTEANLIDVDAEIRKLQRGTGIQPLVVEA